MGVGHLISIFARIAIFYKFLDYGDEVLADRGFQIKEDLLLYYCKLFVPPGARAKAQMSAAECKKTKEIANVRIHVERATNRRKEFKILKNVMPVNCYHMQMQ